MYWEKSLFDVRIVFIKSLSEIPIFTKAYQGLSRAQNLKNVSCKNFQQDFMKNLFWNFSNEMRKNFKKRLRKKKTNKPITTMDGLGDGMCYPTSLCGRTTLSVETMHPRTFGCSRIKSRPARRAKTYPRKSNDAVFSRSSHFARTLPRSLGKYFRWNFRPFTFFFLFFTLRNCDLHPPFFLRVRARC